MNDKEIAKVLADHEARLAALEIMSNKKSTRTISKSGKISKGFSGPKGGILLLLDRGFLDTKKVADEVCSALDKEGYVYTKQVVQNALNRLSTKKGPLVVIDEKDKRIYVKRK